MLTVQPASITFCRKRLSPEEIRRRQEENEYSKSTDELRDIQEDFNSLANNQEFKMPKAAKLALAGGAVITTGLLGGMATGWGAKKSIEGVKKLMKTDSMQSVKKHVIAIKQFIKDSYKTIKEKFVASDAYKMPKNWMKKNYEKFSKTKIGEPIVRFFNSAGKFIKGAYTKIKTGIKHVIDKIKSIKSETWEKTVVNTTGTAGGISSGVMAIKEKSEADE